MGHVITDKKKLLQRIHRIRGQVEGIERAITEDADCLRILQTAASARGALLGLMGILMEDHLLEHVLERQERPTSGQVQAAEEMVDAMKCFFK